MLKAHLIVSIFVSSSCFAIRFVALVLVCAHFVTIFSGQCLVDVPHFADVAFDNEPERINSVTG